ncbi:MAG: lipoyl synthase [Dehalococcoidia bacterium]|nr:lipoyl synthase [Dehalococcoidia bacterium]
MLSSPQENNSLLPMAGSQPAPVSASPNAPVERRLPEWLKAKLPGGENYVRLRNLMRGMNLHTICEEAHCPNLGECWDAGTATFLILGDICTRSCAFCAVQKGKPGAIDKLEPLRLSNAVKALNLKHCVITSVNRDDAPDGGSEIFAECIRQIHAKVPGCAVEVLIPDFMGNWDALKVVMDARPEVLNHNTETVQRLYRRIRPKAVYERSLELLLKAKQIDRTILTKTGIMVGLGETTDEIRETMADIHDSEVDILTIGQYLRPSEKHAPVMKFYTPQEFRELAEEGTKMGIRHVESGPLVRSSYHANKQVEKLTI